MENKENRYCKEKLLTFDQFRDRRDLLTALLEDGHAYTIKEAQAAIKRFMKRRTG